MNRARLTPQVLSVVAGTLVLGLVVGWVIGHYTASTKTAEGPQAIEKAPNFSASDLSALPKDDWPTVGGSLMQERYSPLDQINVSNVSKLKGVWMTHLNGSALAAKYSAESQPVVYKGVIYITTGNNDVFAVSVASGKILWSYSSGISQKISTICCGWLNRGVAIGDGRVYFGQLDGSVVALDQQTGTLHWK
jgi:alcohol dehydrogenase (cytochrome c)